jgi:hypothetical protein
MILEDNFGYVCLHEDDAAILDMTRVWRFELCGFSLPRLQCLTLTLLPGNDSESPSPSSGGKEGGSISGPQDEASTKPISPP